MIAVEKFGSNFMGALAYNLKKLAHPDKTQQAELLATSFSSLSVDLIRKEVELIRQQRPALVNYVWHTSLNFHPDEKPQDLTNDRLLDIAQEYMKAMGYDDNQYLIVRHHDAGHPHVHLLLNRIRYDGSVVSDSNNYRKSLLTLRDLEKRYNLISLAKNNRVTGEQGNRVTAELNNHGSGRSNSRATRRSLTKNEIEKTIRTGIPSDKSLLQAMLDPIVYEKKLSLLEFIKRSEQQGICLLFNQASTGRISGITYFFNDFKIRGQALGNRFKWAELQKHIDYEQDRDSKAVSQANDRTKTKYGDQTAGTAYAAKGWQRGPGTGVVPENIGGSSAQYTGDKSEAGVNTERPLETDQDARVSDHCSIDIEHDGFDYSHGIQISDDADDEAIHGKKRNRQKKSGKSRR